MGRKNEKYNEKGILYGVMKFMTFCLLIIILIAAILLGTRLKTVTVDGSNHYSKEEIQNQVLADEMGKNSLLLYFRHKYGKEKVIPFIEKLDVTLVDRNTIHLQVYEKKIIGCIEYMNSYLYFDKDGIIVESSSERVPEVPIVTGLTFSKMTLYEKLEVEQRNAFHLILNITQLIWRYQIDADTIRFTPELEVILECNEIEVLLGKRESYDEQLAQLPNLLLSAQNADANKKMIIDMKAFNEGQDKIIAKPKE